MNRHLASPLILFILISTGWLSLAVDNAAATSHDEPPMFVAQFGPGFSEFIIADSSDALSTPRDLEFNPDPTRNDELWVINQASESMTIIYDTGTTSQSSENKHDSNGNHFMSQPSAFAFGQYHSEFGTIFASAQESDNGNNFMGPALWPSSPDHFAEENQEPGGRLGSHLDMLHESPFGMGIAHDSGNAYWYFDGHYGELVYYDFVDDHDTGNEEHADGIVRRYSEIDLTRRGNVPGHMILDKNTGILYIADTGTGRILWVNTDDVTTTSTAISNDGTQMEQLHEYSRISGVEWGVLASGLNRPSGIALHDGILFVSTNWDGDIRAWDLANDGKSAILMQTVSTSANSIMGLEVGPNGKLYYADAGANRIVRLDPYSDLDLDGVRDSLDNCPDDQNYGQDNHDGDNDGDICDSDDDGDSILDQLDDCDPDSNIDSDTNWLSTESTDYDGDGCQDEGEDDDDDQDGVLDNDDRCNKGMLSWLSNDGNDFDGDGCNDSNEDDDDDDDHICDIAGPGTECIRGWPAVDRCQFSSGGFWSTLQNDKDQDGCRDSDEDIDDDDDGFSDLEDECPNYYGNSTEGGEKGCTDSDGDGWHDDIDEFPAEPSQWNDTDKDGYGDESDGVNGDACPGREGTSTLDRLGCPDADFDNWSDKNDAFPTDETQWADQDSDTYGDESDGFQPDACLTIAGTSFEDRFGCLDSDSDGWSDEGDDLPNNYQQRQDSDGDGYGDLSNLLEGDDCPQNTGNSTLDRTGCVDSDGDGWSDQGDVFPDDVLLWSDEDGDGYADQEGKDDCPEIKGTSTVDAMGCLDSDGDGTSDTNDFYPLDVSRSIEVDNTVLFSSIGGIILLIILGGLALVLRGKEDDTLKDSPFSAEPGMMPMQYDGLSPGMQERQYQAPLPVMMPQQFQAPQPLQYQAPTPTAQGPTIPPEGLPPGWTMEQWSYYGQKWLEDNGRV